jgi:hypothetical protein
MMIQLSEKQRKISAILFKHDPMNLKVHDGKGNFNSDEYDSKARMIIEQQNIARNVDELEQVIIKIFVAMFNKSIMQKSKADWRKIAQEIWDFCSRE